MDPLLEVRDLVTELLLPTSRIRAVDGVSLAIPEGSTLGLVGESGSGKSATCRSIVQLFGSAPGQITQGSVRLDGAELVNRRPAEMRRVRGRKVSMIFQDPMTALNPTMRIGDQVLEAIRAHANISRQAAMDRAVDLLAAVQVPNPESRLKAYPHELSGGLRQRAVIAMALAGEPRLILADEPTTALDMTVQDQILKLLRRVQAQRGAAIMLVTHDIGVVAQACDRVAVMYAGRIVETGTVREVLKDPVHPYTEALLDALPSATRATPLRPIPGAPPSLAAPPPGCRFQPRCPMGDAACAAAVCNLVPVSGSATHHHACIKRA